MSLIHYEPDIAATPCLGCNELVHPDDLDANLRHFGSTSITFHPYHFWCIRNAPPAPNGRRECADCGARLDRDDARDILLWAATFEKRVRRRFSPIRVRNPRIVDDPDAHVPRPPGLRVVAVRAEAPSSVLLDRVEPILGLDSANRSAEIQLRSQFEIVHDACPDSDPRSWLDQLRAAPDDADLRAVYADHLEQDDKTAEATYVRGTIDRLRATTDDERRSCAAYLRAHRHQFTGTWVRAVCGRTYRAP
jgi:uncharacterized protein (TIGR02996 family)